MVKIREFKLEPMGGVRTKSHYGKAYVRMYGDSGVYSLISYGHEVAAGLMGTDGKAAEIFRIYDGTFDAVFGGWSATTARHLESFAAFIGGEYGGKAAWTAKPYTTIQAVMDYAKNGGTLETVAA